jgi:hypothetical protein
MRQGDYMKCAHGTKCVFILAIPELGEGLPYRQAPAIFIGQSELQTEIPYTNI